MTDNEQKGKKRKSFEDAEQSEVDKVIKTDNKVDVGKIKADENNGENNTNTLRFSNERTDKVKSEDGVVNKTIEKPTRTLSRQNINKGENDIKATGSIDDVHMRSLSQDHSVKSTSPAVKSKHSHSRHKSPRSPSRNSSSRHSRSSRRDRSRRDHRDRSRERRSTRRRENKEKCRDYEGNYFTPLEMFIKN